ncbi:MAG TPA: gamma-glutamylcyclotransferase family protein [Pirellulaceae bacterium]|nr:gamma-glutamylcyclotransferase family protein [Pirellulaceae bacterium]
MSANQTPHAIFVYGTLKRGQCRERAWPRRPLGVESAWTLGRLYDLGPYPALIEGTDRVLGEVWRFAPEDMRESLRVLDGIEGFRDQSDDLYRREVVECTTESGIVVRAYTYCYARPLPAGARLVTANASGFLVWS